MTPFDEGLAYDAQRVKVVLVRVNGGTGSSMLVQKQQELSNARAFDRADKRSISEIDISCDQDLRSVLDCEMLTVCGYLGGADGVICSHDYLGDAEIPRHWFQIDTGQNPPSSYPIAGRGVAIGTGDNGENIAAEISSTILALILSRTVNGEENSRTAARGGHRTEPNIRRSGGNVWLYRHLF